MEPILVNKTALGAQNDDRFLLTKFDKNVAHFCQACFFMKKHVSQCRRCESLMEHMETRIYSSGCFSLKRFMDYNKRISIAPLL